MSTRSLTIVQDESLAELCVMYRHSDGYPTGHGDDLAKWLKGFKVVNGLSGQKGKVANGMDCLAAQLVAHFKDGPGGIYLHPSGVRGAGEEYIYFVRPDHGGVILRVTNGEGKELFIGAPSTFDGEKVEAAE
jgi:hypothetical protein